MSLLVLTGGVRSGKSSAAERLAAARGGAVVAAVAGWEGDDEMARRIAEHGRARATGVHVRTVDADPAWIREVPGDSVLLLDCLATLVGAIVHEEVGEGPIARADEEERSLARAMALVDALCAREGDTVVVTNEAGWGVVPAFPSGRVFRDVLGRANGELVRHADAAWLVIDGRLLDLTRLPSEPGWPAPRDDMEG